MSIIKGLPDKTLYCFGCGAVLRLKRDKYGRPYCRCHMCGISVFLRTDVSEAGFWVLQNIIRSNPKGFRTATYAAAIKICKTRRDEGIEDPRAVLKKTNKTLRTPDPQ